MLFNGFIYCIYYLRISSEVIPYYQVLLDGTLKKQMKNFTTVILYCHITLYHTCTLCMCMRINCRMVDLSFIKVTFWLYNIVLWSMSLGHMKPASFTLWLSVYLSLNSFCEFSLFTGWKYVYYSMYLCAWII